MRAIIYAAKSSEDVHGSIPTQLADCRRMAEREGWQVAGEFQDEGFSAYSGNRGPGLEEAKALAVETATEDGEAVLIVQHSDRLARGAGDSPDAADHLVEVLTWANRHRVTLRTVQDDFLGDPRMALLMAAVQGQRNTEDSRRKSVAVKDGKRRSRQRGRPQGGKRRFGFNFDAGALVPVAAEVATVGRILDEILAGRSLGAIARELEAAGVATASGGKWHQATISEIARNPIYVGKLRTKEGVVEGAHEAVVDVERWERVQQLLDAKAIHSKGRGRSSAGRHVFRKGMLRCGGCGESMVPRTSRRKDGSVYAVYYCYGRSRDASSCSMTPIRREAVDTAVYRYFEDVGLDVEATRAQLQGERNRSIEGATALLAAAADRERKAEDAFKRVRGYFRNGDLALDIWELERPELAEDLDVAQRETGQRRKALAEIQNDSALEDAEHEVLLRLAEIRQAAAGEIADSKGPDAIRAALSRLFERFVLHPATEAKLGPQKRDEAFDGPDRAPLVAAGDYLIEIHLRDEVLDRWGDLGRHPVLRRIPLHACETNKASPSSSRRRRPPTDSTTPSTRSPQSPPRPT